MSSKQQKQRQLPSLLHKVIRVGLVGLSTVEAVPCSISALPLHRTKLLKSAHISSKNNTKTAPEMKLSHTLHHKEKYFLFSRTSYCKVGLKLNTKDCWENNASTSGLWLIETLNFHTFKIQNMGSIQ